MNIYTSNNKETVSVKKAAEPVSDVTEDSANKAAEPVSDVTEDSANKESVSNINVDLSKIPKPKLIRYSKDNIYNGIYYGNIDDKTVPNDEETPPDDETVPMIINWLLMVLLICTGINLLIDETEPTDETVPNDEETASDEEIVPNDNDDITLIPLEHYRNSDMYIAPEIRDDELYLRQQVNMRVVTDENLMFIAPEIRDNELNRRYPNFRQRVMRPADFDERYPNIDEEISSRLLNKQIKDFRDSMS